jgi:hypothetical protein
MGTMYRYPGYLKSSFAIDFSRNTRALDIFPFSHWNNMALSFNQSLHFHYISNKSLSIANI